MITRTRLNVTLYVHCLSCFVQKKADLELYFDINTTIWICTSLLMEVPTIQWNRWVQMRAQRSSQRIRRFLPGSSGTNRTPADPPAPLSLQHQIFWGEGGGSVLLAEGSTLDPVTWSEGQTSTPGRGTAVSYPWCLKAFLANVMGWQLSHLEYHLAKVPIGHPSLFNGHRKLFHLGYLLLVISRGHPSLFNGERELLHQAYLLTTVSSGHPSLCNGYRQLFRLGYLPLMISRGHPGLFNRHRQLFHLGYLSHGV